MVPTRSRRSPIRRARVTLGILLLVGCTPLPPVTPASGELPTLEARVDRSPTDTESVLRLAAGLWRTGDRGRARRVLQEARAEVPEAHAYTAALGTTAEASGEYFASRELYLDFLRAVGPSDLSEVVAERVSFLGGLTADSLARILVDGNRSLDHGQDPARVISVPRIQAAPGDPDLQRLALVMTELLVRDLRDRGFMTLDWELSEAVRQRTISQPRQGVIPEVMAERLSARVVVMGAVQDAGQDSVAIDLRVFRSDARGGGSVSSERLTLGTGSYAPHRASLSTRVFEMVLGASEGAVSPAETTERDFASREALDRFGDGLLLTVSDERAAARQAFADALRLAPGFPPVTDRLRQMERLDAVRESETMPLAEDILGFSRAVERTRAAIRMSGGGGEDASTRSGVGEVLGLDRVGSQVFMDLLITVGGGT